MALLAIGQPAGAAPSPNQAAGAPGTELQRRAQARIDAAQKRIDLLVTLYQAGAISVNELLEAKMMKFLAQRDSGVSGATLVDAAKSYRDDLSRLAESMKARISQGLVTVAELATMDYRLAEAEYWLEDARFKVSH